MNLVWALGASIIVSLISFIGIISLLLKENLLKEILLLLISFSAGALIGGAFLHLIPEAVEKTRITMKYIYLLLLGLFCFLS
ncbi:MAG: ZIP Zinc transporter [Candidatus Omnitrophica bacterium ADurb.Bin205]|nr:MAG: ZIP Zinc transporter [Candidatus Omnitrophica bacterium ADurb.Bin205]